MAQDTTVIEPSYDAIVIGARAAGGAAAMLLARRGLRVLLIDRAQRGSDTLSTHAILRGGVLQLSRWGLLDRIGAAGTPPVRSVSFHYGDEVIAVPIKPRDGVDALYGPRRTVLDAILADAAEAAGADVRFGPRLLDMTRTSTGRVAGVVLEDRQAGVLQATAGIVIGADGLNSTVARLVGAETYRTGCHAAATVYGYWSDVNVEPNQYHWHFGSGVAAGVIPTNGDVFCVFASVPAARFERETRKDIEAGYFRALRENSVRLAEAIERARPAGRLRGFQGEVGRYRQCWGTGWALVGDAGYFKDPITAHGITDAFRDAELLANAVTAGSEHALSGYQTTRDALTRQVFDASDEIAGFQWTLESIRELHHRLNDGMKAEVEHLRALDRSVPAIGREA
jgi:flavin-dependent dehydrogenase